VITAAHPERPLAQAAARALTRPGATPTLATDGDLPATHVLLSVDRIAIAVACDPGGGFVTSPTTPAHARADAAAVTARLSAPADPATTSSVPALADDSALAAPLAAPTTPSGSAITDIPPTASGQANGGFVTSPTNHAGGSFAARPADPPPALVALLAGAAAQRLLCAVAGLPDPADHDAPRLLPGRPAVLLAQARPAQADYHPWVASPSAPGREPDAPPPGNLAEALHRITALADPRLGVLDAPRPGSLPQLPAALVSCRTPVGTVAAGAARTDLARLEAACLAAELQLTADSFTPIVVGADNDHALGRALRRAALALPADGPEPSGTSWHDHPQARHWWTTLTRCRPAYLMLRQFGSENAYLAIVRTSDGRLLARSVESTPADAVATAALAALTRVMADDHGLTTAHHAAMTGATAPLAASGVSPAAWEDEGWTGRWLAGLAAREPALRTALHRLTGLRTAPWQSAHPLAAALRACGFTLLTTARDQR
jgi:hypothetical protein